MIVQMRERVSFSVSLSTRTRSRASPLQSIGAGLKRPIFLASRVF